jgi:hypothetical protein
MRLAALAILAISFASGGAVSGPWATAHAKGIKAKASSTMQVATLYMMDSG